MNINLEIFEKLTSERDTRSAKLQRQNLWMHCDTNENGFASITDINQEFSRIFNLDEDESEQFKILVKKSLEELRKKYDVTSHFGQNYIEQKEFRLFIINLYRNIVSLRKFEKYIQFEAQKIDGKNIDSQLQKLQIEPSKIVAIRKISQQKKLQFEQFDLVLNPEWKSIKQCEI